MSRIAGSTAGTVWLSFRVAGVEACDPGSHFSTAGMTECLWRSRRLVMFECPQRTNLREILRLLGDRRLHDFAPHR